MMTSQYPVGPNDAWIHIYNSWAFQIYNKIWGFPCVLRSCGSLKIGMFLRVILHRGAHGFQTLARACDIMVSLRKLKIVAIC